MAMSLLQCDNMSDFIKYEADLNISHKKLHLQSKLTDNSGAPFVVNSNYLLSKYFDVVKKYTADYTMSDKEYIKYKYQPKMFCSDKLGTTELWSILLRLNNMTSFIEFDHKTIRVPAASMVKQIINEVAVLDADLIKRNKTSLI